MSLVPIAPFSLVPISVHSCRFVVSLPKFSLNPVEGISKSDLNARCERTVIRDGLTPEIPRNHEPTTMKKQIDPPIKAHLPRNALMILLVGGGVALGFVAPGSAGNLPEQSTSSPASFQPGVATHETRVQFQASLQKLIEFPYANEVTVPIETVSSAPPMRNRFMATWNSISGAKGYLLDVSTTNS